MSTEEMQELDLPPIQNNDSVKKINEVDWIVGGWEWVNAHLDQLFPKVTSDLPYVDPKPCKKEDL